MATTPVAACEVTTDGPVLNLINKRLRALRKKLNRISQMEESVAQGKTLNKEQEETLRSKSTILGGIDELEKLRQPILQAVDQEIQLALEKNKQSPETQTEEITDEEGTVEHEVNAEKDSVSGVPDLLSLMYFGSIFDVQTLMRAHDNMLTRTHERNCCLTYDYVTDDDAAGDPLKEWDLDLIAMMGGLLTSRPVNSSFSHKNSLEKCVEHAKLWLANSEQPIEPNSSITYAGLREKLNKIMASDYFTRTPEIKAPVDVAAAVGSYTSFQVPAHGSVIPQVGFAVPMEGSAAEYEQEEEESPNSNGNEIHEGESGHAEEIHQGGLELENVSEHQSQAQDTEVDQNSGEVDLKEQQYGNRRPYQNYRGGGRGGGRRGYGNGRGGRGGGNRGYQNGRGGASQFYDQPAAGNYYPRNNYRGRGGRGMSGNNYSYDATHGGHVQATS